MPKAVVVHFISDASRFKKGVAESSSSLDAFSAKVSSAGKKLTAFASVPIALALGKATKSAMEERKEIALLEGQIKAATGATSVNMKATDKWVTSLQNATAFVDSAVRKSFGMFVNVLKDQKRAQEATAFAADFARAKNISLEEATAALMGAETGRVKALQKLGVQVKEVSVNEGKVASARLGVEKATIKLSDAERAHGKGSLQARDAAQKLADANKTLQAELSGTEGRTLTLTEIMDRNKDAVQGTALAYAEGAGKAEVMKNKLADLSESIGGVLLPFIDKLTETGTKVADWFEGLSDGQKEATVNAGLLVIALGPVLKIVGSLKAAILGLGGVMAWLAGNPIFLALAALALAVGIALKNFESFKLGLEVIWDAIGRIAATAVNSMISLFEALFQAIMSPLRVLGEIPGVPGRGKMKELARMTFTRVDWSHDFTPDWAKPSPIDTGGGTRGGIQEFHHGGLVPGSPSQEMLGILRGGERVSPSGGSSGVTVIVQGSLVMEREVEGIVRRALLQTGRRNASLGTV